MRSKVYLILLLILCCLYILTGCLEGAPPQPRASAGVIDLRGYPLSSYRTRLDGEWQFFPFHTSEQLINSEEQLINIPGSWNQHMKHEQIFAGQGYGTFRLVFMVDDHLDLGLKIPRIFTAYDLLINGEKVATAGQPGQSRDAVIPAYLPQSVNFTTQPGENELLVYVSNFHHRSGGLLESIEIGSDSLIQVARTHAIAYDLFIFGSLFMMGIYHLAVYFFRRKYQPPLFFGIFCLLIAIRTLLVGERYFLYLFSEFSWELAHKIQTITYYAGMPVILLFCYSFFSGWFSKKIIKSICLISLPFILAVMFMPARYFTLINPGYQLFSIFTIFYLVITLTKILFKEKGKNDLPVIIVGAFILILSSLNDILFTSIWLNDHQSPFLRTVIRTGNLSSIGQIVFVMTFALMMARRISESYRNEEAMTSQLKEANRNLDRKVALRTKSLAEAAEKVARQKEALEHANKKLQSLSLKDPLTNLWNRRQYKTVINQEWNRALRRQTELSMLVIDIDFFKSYNDNLGHAQGDACLIQLANLLKENFQRAGELSARYGGEEFVVILPNTSPDIAYEVSSRFCRKVESLAIQHPESTISDYVTVSIGVAGMVPDKMIKPSQLFDQADKAMYQAKTNGRNQASVYQQQGHQQ